MLPGAVYYHSSSRLDFHAGLWVEFVSGSMFFESCLGFCGAAGFSPMQQCLHLGFKRRVLGMDRSAPSVCFFFQIAGYVI